MKKLICIFLLLIFLLPVWAAQAQEERKTWQKLEELNWYLFEKELLQGPFDTWPIEDKHAWNEMEIQAGYTSPHVIHGLPDEKSMAQEEALAVAEQIFENAKPGAMNSPSYRGVYITYNVIDPDKPLWEFVFVLSNSGGFFTEFPVHINAYTQDVVYVNRQPSIG